MLNRHNTIPSSNIFPSSTAEASLFAGTAIDPATGKLMELPARLKSSEGAEWTHSHANEIGRLAQGVGTRMLIGTNTIFFIPHKRKPSHKKSPYVQIVCANRPQKEEKKRVRWAAGGDRVIYEGDLITPAANIVTVKFYINSTIFDPNAKYYTMDVKDFYLGTPTKEFEYL